MTSLFPDLLRAVITDIMLILLLSTMATPKYKNKFIYFVITAIILVSNVSTNYYFYLKGNYTAVFYVDLVMLLGIGIVLKPFFKDKFMQWCFSFITLLNIYLAIVFLSYILRGIFPNPIYGVINLRLLLFLIVIFVFHKRVSKPYRNVLEYWHIYIMPTVALLACLLSYLFGGGIEKMLLDHYMPLMLLILLGLSVYVSIFHSFKTITKHYAIREENQKMQAEREYLQLAAENMSERLKLLEELSLANEKLKTANFKLEQISTIDVLTSIENRRAFNSEYNKAWKICVREKMSLAVIMIDIDHFKIFNDTYGHLAGDQVLTRTAEVIKGAIKRPGDLVARFGGEEFVIMLMNTASKGAEIVAEEIRRKIEDTEIEIGEQRSSITVSLGVASVIPDNKMDPDGLIDFADRALYQAKAGGRNKVIVWED